MGQPTSWGLVILWEQPILWEQSILWGQPILWEQSILWERAMPANEQNSYLKNQSRAWPAPTVPALLPQYLLFSHSICSSPTVPALLRTIPLIIFGSLLW